MTSLPSNYPTLLSQPRPTSTYTKLRPWHQLFSPISSFTRPYSFGEASMRINRNFSYFRFNYVLILLFALFLGLLWHPVSMILFLLVFVAWLFLFFFRNEPFQVFNRVVDDRLVLGLLGLLTIVALVLTHVWINVLVSISIGVLVVGLHAVFRSPEDLYVDEHEDGNNGGLFSVVGSPIRTGYERI